MDANAVYLEKRAEPRFDRRLAIVGTILQCDADETLEGCPIHCETVNVSGHGLQFRSDLVLEAGTKLNISVAYTATEIYKVIGQVRWCREEGGAPLMGVQLFEDASSDFAKWYQLIQEMLY